MTVGTDHRIESLRQDTAVRLALLLALVLAAGALLAVPAPGAERTGRGPSHFLRAAYQLGPVLETNDFLGGDNRSGRPIDRFQSVRVEFGWQSDGSRDWHHAYNFPTYGLGLYGADLDNDAELGTPTSLYGFFTWPLLRSERWTGEFLLAFGLTNDWKPYDPIENPRNVAMGLGRSVHIEVGATVQYRLAHRWSLVGGVTATHFSNGGTQRPNHGLNQLGPILYARYDTDDPVPLPARRDDVRVSRTWDLTVTASAGKRNLDLPLDDPDLREQYGNRSYAIVNATLGAGYRVSFKSRLAFGLDLAYDGTVGDLMRIDAFQSGGRADPVFTDHLELGVFGGYEILAHRTHAILHLGYKVVTREVPDRLPRFYQRLGIRQFVYRDLFAGLNVRFHEIGSADNLEWTVGYQWHR